MLTFPAFTNTHRVYVRPAGVPSLKQLGPGDRVPYIVPDIVTYHFSVARGGFTLDDRGATPDQFPPNCVERLGKCLVIGFNHEAKAVAIMFGDHNFERDFFQAMGFVERIRAVWEPKGYVVVL